MGKEDRRPQQAKKNFEKELFARMNSTDELRPPEKLIHGKEWFARD